MSDVTRRPISPCPRCRKEAVELGSKHFPFCSSRCRNADLQGWLDEDYKIPGQPVRLDDALSDEEEHEAGETEST